MSDLISRSALIEELKRYEEELKNDREIAIETDDEQMLFAIMNQETAICRIRRNVLYLPTAYDVEKVVAELEKTSCFIQSEDGCGWLNFTEEAIDIVKRGGVE